MVLDAMDLAKEHVLGHVLLDVLHVQVGVYQVVLGNVKERAWEHAKIPVLVDVLAVEIVVDVELAA